MLQTGGRCWRRGPFLKASLMVLLLSGMVLIVVVVISNYASISLTWMSIQNRIIRGNDKELSSSLQSHSSQDLEDFTSLVQSWPEKKPKALIYMLVSSQPGRMSGLISILLQVQKHFNHRYHYPIVIFHEADWTLDMIETLKSIVPESSVYFQLISMEAPAHLEAPLVRTTSCPATQGYRHMCRFHARLVYDQPIMKHVTYYWRLDDDSRIESDINYDVFKLMEEDNFVYGYYLTSYEAPRCSLYLESNVTDYIRRKNLSPFNSWPSNYILYNNFEVSRADLWTSAEYQSFIDFIDRLGGIYYYRWGDAPIKTAAVALLIPATQIHQFSGFTYHHQDR